MSINDSLLTASVLVCYELIRITIKILLMMGVHYKYSRINAVTQINGVISIPRGEFWVSMIESNQPIQLSDRMDTIYHHCRPIQYYNISILHNLHPSCCCQTQIGAGVWKYNNCSENHWHIIFIKISHIYTTKIMWILLFYDVSFDKWIEFKFLPETSPTLVDTADIGVFFAKIYLWDWYLLVNE